jgi:hypothetical protein
MFEEQLPGGRGLRETLAGSLPIGIRPYKRVERK